MKKIQILGLSLVAVFALSASVASMASAAEWLVKGEALLTAAPSEGTGELELGDAKLGLLMTCSGILVGTVGPGAADTVTEVLKLKQRSVFLSKTA